MRQSLLSVEDPGSEYTSSCLRPFLLRLGSLYRGAHDYFFPDATGDTGAKRRRIRRPSEAEQKVHVQWVCTKSSLLVCFMSLSTCIYCTYYAVYGMHPLVYLTKHIPLHTHSSSSQISQRTRMVSIEGIGLFTGRVGVLHSPLSFWSRNLVPGA